MADDLVQLDDGEWMRIDRRLWDALGRYKFSERELTVLKKIIRWTYGCITKAEEGKDHGRYCIIDKLEEAAEAMGLHHPALTTTLESLQQKQVIYALLGIKPKVIVFNKYWHSWKVPLRSKYNEEADSRIITRNLNYSTIDEAIGEEAFRQMKKAYQFDKELNESLRKAYRIDKELNDLGSKELINSLSGNSQDASKINSSQPLKENKNKDNIYIYTDLLEKLEFLPGVIDISKDEDKEYFEYIKSFDAEKIDTVLAEAQRRTKLKAGDKDKLQRKSVLKFIAGGLENYELLYASKKPSKKLTPKEQAVAQGIKIIQAYQAHPDMIQSKRQLSSLIKHYEQYEDYGELVNMTLEQVNQAIGEE